MKIKMNKKMNKKYIFIGLGIFFGTRFLISSNNSEVKLESTKTQSIKKEKINKNNFYDFTIEEQKEYLTNKVIGTTGIKRIEWDGERLIIDSYEEINVRISTINARISSKLRRGSFLKDVDFYFSFFVKDTDSLGRPMVYRIYSCKFSAEIREKTNFNNITSLEQQNLLAEEVWIAEMYRERFEN